MSVVEANENVCTAIDSLHACNTMATMMELYNKRNPSFIDHSTKIVGPSRRWWVTLSACKPLKIGSLNRIVNTQGTKEKGNKLFV